MQVPGQRVVHLLGRLTDSVHRLLGPATDTLAQAGCRQQLVLLQDPRHPGLVDDFDLSVTRVVLPYTPNPITRWRHWVRAVRHVLAQGQADVVHLHGFIPSVLASPLVGRYGPAHCLYSPHGSRAQQTATRGQRLASWLARPLLRHVAGVTVVAMPVEARVLRPVPGAPVAQLDVPVHRAHFDAPRRPSRYPLVVGGVFDEPAIAAARFTQLAVLMGAGEGELSFNWLGAAWGKAHDQLEAASIAIFDERSAESRATRLSAAWVYLCPHATRGFPGHLAEAMACGLPVVAVDAPLHRDLLQNGVTGLLCTGDQALLEGVASLLADPALRERMGRAAREAAWQRFGSARFDAALLRAYARQPSTNIPSTIRKLQ